MVTVPNTLFVWSMNMGYFQDMDFQMNLKMQTAQWFNKFVVYSSR